MNGVPVDVTGGAPLLLDLPITLCSRSDANSSRYFDGELLCGPASALCPVPCAQYLVLYAVCPMPLACIHEPNYALPRHKSMSPPLQARIRAFRSP